MLIEPAKAFVEHEFMYNEAIHTSSSPELIELNTMLNSKSHLLQLYVGMVECVKILHPYMHLLKVKKRSFMFYPALVPSIAKLKELAADPLVNISYLIFSLFRNF